MVIHLQQLYQIMSLFLLLLLFIPKFAVFATGEVFINFGLPKSPPATSNDNRWLQSDENFAVTPSSSTAVTTLVGADAPYDVARIFMAPVTYSVPISSIGPKLVRLYFPSPSLLYNSIEMQNSFLNLNISGFEILSNFSSYLVASNAIANPNTTMPLSINNGYVREVYVTTTKSIDFTFAPSNPKGGFGLINGVEIVSVHDELYVNHSKEVTYLADTVSDYADNTYPFPKSLAMENIIRLNVGGNNINDPGDDTGIGRLWYRDDDYFLIYDANGIRSHTHFSNHSNEDVSKRIRYTKIPSYTAPKVVYATMRTVGPYYPKLKNLNLSWKFEVDAGFDYLVRLHFCQLTPVEKTGQMLFTIYINNQEVPQDMDVLASAGGQFIPIYKDFVTTVDDTTSNETRAILWVALHPNSFTAYDDTFLNGLEIFKLMTLNGSLAAPNPELPTNILLSPTNPTQNKSNSHRLLAILGGTLGVSLVLLGILACFTIIYLRNKANKQKFMDATSMQDSSKLKWWFAMDDSASTATSASMVSSLPSELCRHFSLAQIKIATGNFDKKLIVGKGGFGEVYKGSITDPVNGTIQVAIKRLNTKSKQGAREFQTEIEMLSRLRHLHLVSLIGYCEDEGEMILVYEYMSRGTLRDHLMYKKSDKTDPNKTPLSWKQRLMICVGSARGLHYLHTGARQLIIHRDVKSTNILLDDKWTAKVSDFGLSKAGPISLGLEMGPTHISTAVKGSAGYLDPEYYRCHKLTEKSDVYSFGVVMFEVLCARAAVNPALPREQANLAMWAQNHYKKGTLHSIVDPNISSQIEPECLKKFGEVAELCVRDHGNERPSMGDVVWGLEFALQLQETAENNTNISSVNSLEEVMGPNSSIGDNNDGNTDNEGFTFSRSSNNSVATKKLMDSKSTTSNSSDFRVNMNSALVFSEIIDPTAR